MNYHLPGRSTPDLRDDYASEGAGVIAIEDGRLGDDMIDESEIPGESLTLVDDRRNVRPLPSSVPDPYRNRRSL